MSRTWRCAKLMMKKNMNAGNKFLRTKNDSPNFVRPITPATAAHMA